MSDFDVDCPHTPDGDTITVDDSKRISVDDKPHPSPKRPNMSNSRPTSVTRARSSAGIEVAVGTTPRATTIKMFSPRSQLGKAAQLRRGQSSTNNKGGGLEPEEYIAPKAPPPPPRRTPSAGGVPRPPTSDTNRAGNNPFDDKSVTYDGASRSRTYSGNMWKEEIVNEGGNKIENIDNYYGLDLHEKQKIYGPSTTVAMDVEQGANNHATTGTLNTSVYHHAASLHNAGHVKVTTATTMEDDYTFSDVDLSGARVADSSSYQRRNIGGGGSLRDILLEWCINNLSSKSSSTIDPFTHHRYGKTKKDGWWDRQSPVRKMGVGLIWMILMCTIFGVTVSQLKSNNSVPSEKEESNALRAFDDTSGLNMNDIYLAPPAPEVEPTTFPTGMPTEEPTLPQPTMMPVTESPIAQNYLVHSKTSGMTVTRPTFPPVTSKPSLSPIVKVSAAQVSSDSPTVTINSVQAAPGSEVLNDDMDGDEKASRIGADWLCVDISSGLYKNHLGNPFNCTWLHNDKDGYTDRKDKNCGGRIIKNELWGGTMVYPTSELGGVCRSTCRLYNGCDSSSDASSAANGTTPGMTAMTGQIVSKKHFSPCQDSQGEFLNHLKNMKTCDWLYNDKPGMTDRKNKECGTDGHPVTDLGLACPSTCSVYNKGECIGSKVKEMTPNDDDADEDKDEEENSKLAAVLKDMEVIEEEVIKLTDARKKGTTPAASTKKESEKRTYNTSTLPTCTDAKGEYLSHQSKLKDCNWLYNNKEGRTVRKDMNCGTPKYPLTELGEKCRNTCSVYDTNGCLVDEVIKKDAGQVTRSYSSKLYSFSLSSPEK